MRNKGRFNGVRGIRRIESKFVAGPRIGVRVMKATPGTVFTPDDIDKYLDAVEKELAEKYPMLEWRMVEKGPGRFTFVAELKHANPIGSHVHGDSHEAVLEERPLHGLAAEPNPVNTDAVDSDSGS